MVGVCSGEVAHCLHGYEQAALFVHDCIGTVFQVTRYELHDPGHRIPLTSVRQPNGILAGGGK